MSGGGLGRRDPCTSCGLPVFLAQRLKVERRLYHRTCFRCARCNTQLTLANCYQTEIDGQFCCETCPDEDSDINDYQADDTDSQKSYVQAENSQKISQSALFDKEDNNTVILNKIESHELNVQDFSSNLPTKINNKDKPSAASVAFSGFMKSQFDHSTANDDNTLPALPKNCPPKNISLNNSSDSFDFLTGPQLSELNETHHIGNKKFKNNENHTNAMIISHTSNSSASLKRIDKKISTIDSVVSDTSENNKQCTTSPCIIESKDIYSSFNKNNDNCNLVKDSLFTGIKYRESVIPTQEDIKSSTQNVNIEDLCYVNQPETASVIENINDSNLSEGADSVNSFKYGVLAKDKKKEIRSSNDRQNVTDNVDTMNDITKPNQSIVKMRMKIFERDSLTNHGKAKDPTVSNQIKIENLIPDNHQSNKVTSADKASLQDLNVTEDKNNTVNNDFGNIDACSKGPPKQIEEVLSEDTIHEKAKIEDVPFEDTICAKIEIEGNSPEDTMHENIVEVLSEDTAQGKIGIEKVFPEDSSHENIEIERVLPEDSAHKSIEIEGVLPEDSSHENIKIEGVLPEYTTHGKTKNDKVISETILENLANSHNLAISQISSVNNITEISEDDDILNSDNNRDKNLTENDFKIPQNICKEEISTEDDYSHVSELKVYEAFNKEIVFNKDSLACIDAMELNKQEALNKKTEDLENVHSESTIDEFINIANEDCLSIKETGKNLDDGQYPEHLNPFSDDGSDESEVELSSKKDIPINSNKMERKSPKKTKDKLNPFDSSSDEDEKYTTKNDEFDPTPRKKSAEKPPRPPLPAVLINASKLFDSSSTSTKSDVPSSLNLNPFSDDDDSDADSVIVGKSLMLSQKSLNDDSSSSLLNISTIHGSSSLSLAGSVTKRKKAPAPKPPGVESIHTLKINNSATDVNNDHQNISITSNTSSQNSSINHISPQISPRPLKRKPAPPPPTVSAPIACSTLLDNSICDKEASSISESTYSSSVFQEERSESVVSNNKRVISAADFDNDPDILTNSLWDSEKLRIDDAIKNAEAHEIEGSMSTFSDKSTSGQWKRRKGPAPAIPLLQKRSIGLSMPPALLRKELQMLEAQQRGLERQGVRLEEIIREKCENNVCSDESSEPDPETDELVLQLFELVNEKNDLFRKQAELMYIRRQQRLEEEYADLEHQIRISIAKPDANKTDSDKAKEEQLIQRLVEVVERRNEVVTCLEMDRLREREEDKSIRERMASHRAKRNETQSKPSSPDLSEGNSKKEKKKRWIKKEKLKKEGTSKISPDQQSEQINVKKEKKLKKWF